MIEIKNKDGKVISRSKNQAALRRRISQHKSDSAEGPKFLTIERKRDGGGHFSLEFKNGDVCKFDWASYEVMMRKLFTWKSLWGVTVVQNYHTAGKLWPNNKTIFPDGGPAALKAINKVRADRA